MTARHSQERVVESFDYNGAAAELVEWDATIWCGKIGCAANNADEPDVERIVAEYGRLNKAEVRGRYSPVRDGCVSVNYLSPKRPNGVFFGELVQTADQAEGFDVLRFPAARFLRIRLCAETAAALGKAEWQGGIPPYDWVYDLIAPRFGCAPGDDTLPIIEYYGYYRPGAPETYENKLVYLYVPVA